MEILRILSVLLLAYLVGSIPSGWIVVKIATGKDVLKVESGRTGGTNAMRAAGFFAGLVTAILDVLKGVSTGWIVSWLMPGDVWLQVLAAVLAIIGHNYSVFLLKLDENGRLRFRGGAGGATALGGAIALWPQAWMVILPLAVLVFLLVGYASVTTISIAASALLVFIYRAAVGTSPWVYVLYGALALAIVVIALRPNLERLKRGTERMVGLRAYLLKKAGRKP
ncbi:glycerol-3-phosphate acyltransferase [Levilinea saccharolytica]|uniref:Glycerol-3-phosphate acyltransferase n=1 Tax=Levilinea saccharolytica TaxID=229921 RepID=A0A0N8GRN6_9CHLR|nr:glycerol-3-phosphate acyltransferase [Levilinea saccharolytica]KPL87002.1 hypothetical protein ADN01_05205 [Levilinea saccharolytica]GAP17485.1 acyl-phosphate glycerol-3-phosphate acyltransferase [Levilinea saccharolytica]